ncbi:MAG TPA: class I fructose-bisphosphate aldolase [Acidimicrobiia bacterium]|nr:class I fructose-bisphosphate aldolase [Acidimicrobiia bacterium]
MDITELNTTARALVAPGKGILAADESSGTIKRRFDSINVESTEENRRDYREMLFTTEGAGNFISGVILYDETIRQKAHDGTRLVKLLEDEGIIPGIKVDTGAKPLALAESETITEGLDGLRERLAEYKDLGARFAKWRATYSITDELPSAYCIAVNADALARYAALCQESGLVPIVEPEVLMEGDHTIERSFDVTSAVQHAVFDALAEQRCAYEGLLLKPNMVLPGYDCAQQATAGEVAEATVRCFRSTVPAAVPGVVFLSGGQSDEDATARLSAMNELGPHPWELSFSYGRALQAPALKAWKGDTANLDAGRAAFLHRAKLNSAARYGRYTPDMEKAAS